MGPTARRRYDAAVTSDDGRTAATRIERDSMGEMAVPATARYGATTQRAVINFPISGRPMPARFLHALALVKRAGAETNAELGLLDRDVATAIASAASDVAAGRHDREFPIDVYQTGSGTSTNMNMNEVIANLASERLGGRRVHPNDDVNRSQSSNDAIPTAIQLAGALAIEEALLPALVRLQEALARKADEFWPVVKTGRTHLQAATPIRPGQNFLAYAGQSRRPSVGRRQPSRSCSSFRSAALPSGPASTRIRSTRHARPRGSASSWRWTCARRRTTSTRRRLWTR